MSIFSGIPIAIGGTDLNPAVFYGDFVVAIAEDRKRRGNRGRDVTGPCAVGYAAAKQPGTGGWSLLVVGAFFYPSVFPPEPQTKVGA